MLKKQIIFYFSPIFLLLIMFISGCSGGGGGSSNEENSDDLSENKITGSISIISPKKGEVYNRFEDLKIEWESTQDIDLVDVYLVKSDGNEYQLKKRWPADDAIVLDAYEYAFAEGIYHIKIKDCRSQSEVECMSDSFEISGPLIRIIEPNSETIWDLSGLGWHYEKVKYETLANMHARVFTAIYKGDELYLSYGGKNHSGKGICSHEFEIGSFYGEPGNNYRIITSCNITMQNTNESISFQEFSDYFTITNDWVYFTSPRGGEAWRPGSTHNITWETVGNYYDNYDEISLKLRNDEETKWNIYAENNGNYAWTIPSNIKLDDDYQICILNSV